MNIGVKVMKSYDYCHFEVQLSDDNVPPDKAVAFADAMGAEAQRLVDGQIERYKLFKCHLECVNPFNTGDCRFLVAQIEKVLPKERTPEMKALLKAQVDHEYWLSQGFDYSNEYFPPNIEKNQLGIIAKQLGIKLDDIPF